jgi:hypothetical protein
MGASFTNHFDFKISLKQPAGRFCGGSLKLQVVMV